MATTARSSGYAARPAAAPDAQRGTSGGRIDGGRFPMAVTGNRYPPRSSPPGLAVRLTGLLAVMLIAASCGLTTHKTSGNTPTSGGTASYALPPNANIDYIFPFTPGQYFTVVN